MRKRWLTAFTALVVVAAATGLAAQSNSQQAGAMPPGHGIKCTESDGSTPCTSAQVSGLNQDIATLKQTAGDTKQTVGDSKQAVSDAKQNGSDAKQVESDAKQLETDAKHPVADVKQAVDDAKQAGSDVKQAVSDSKQTKSDAQQAGEDAQQVLEDLKGIGSLRLKSLDGSLNCAQSNGTACTDIETEALKIYAAEKKPPLDIIRQVDQANN